jgi:hypothetical protein
MPRRQHVGNALFSQNLHLHPPLSTAQSRHFRSQSPINHLNQSGGIMDGGWALTTASSGSTLLVVIEPRLWSPPPPNNCATSAWAFQMHGTLLRPAVRVHTQQEEETLTKKHQCSVSNKTVPTAT